MKQSKLYESKKRATVKEARDLRIGDIIECYYADSEKPTHEMVVQTTYNSKEGNYADIRTVRLGGFGERTGAESCGTNWLNTDKFIRVLPGKDVADVLNWLPAIEERQNINIAKVPPANKCGDK